MGTYVVKLPDVGEGIAEAEIVEWHVTVGDTVAEDAPLVDVMTDKATVELPTPVAGTITRLGGESGDVVAIGSDLVWIETDAGPPEPEVTEPEVNGAEVNGADATEPDATEPGVTEAEAPESEPEAAEARTEPAEPPTEPQPQREPEPAERPARTGGALAAPAVRRRAAALGVDLATIDGTGPEGRVVHEDLDRTLADRPTTAPAAPRSTEPAYDDTADDVETVKVIGLRRNIAQRMQESTRRIAHFTYVDEVDMTELERLRGELNGEFEGARPRLSVLPFLMRAIVVAVGDFPQMNARFKDDDGVIERHRAVHLGIATQTPKGLMVPVLHHAEAGDLWTFAADVARLSSTARDGSISLHDLHGSTITITSLGALGGIVTTPVINHPEVAIIGVNKITTQPAWRDGTWVPRQVMNLSSSFDHRVIDGWDAARFIGRIRALLETPARLFVS